MLQKWLPSNREARLRRRDDPENMLDVFEEMWARPFRGFEDFSTVFTPSVEISEKEDEVIVKAEIPGLDHQDIDVSVENNSLILRGDKKREKKEEKENYVHMECSYGSFNRVIPLRVGVDREKVTASYKKGILTVRLPKSETSKSKKIAIEK
ncbi:MAG: Hsp20/alpha crystallin family protein [Desulfonatronovibrio sp. MSAO_Bac4]|nr:MAG: Hsp20/alpha crystallin family protein [Desulfonatronovibrio sp. MSAO_Bac4]